MPQFTRQASRPLTAASYAAAVRRQRQLLDIIERYAEATEPRDKAQLTRAIHGLSLAARALSERHRKQLSASEINDQHQADAYDAQIATPEDHDRE